MTTARTDSKGVVLPCSTCGQKNRIPYERLSATGHCPKCRSAIPPPAVPVEIADEIHFDRLVQGSLLPVVVDFWAPWCAPCRAVAPELEKIAANHQGEYLIIKINTEALPALGQRFNIRSIPTMAVFFGGIEINRTAGARPSSAIETFIRESLRHSQAAR